MFERECRAARRRKDADGRRLPCPRRQRCVEMLNEHATDVAGDPFIKDGDKKTTPLFRGHGAIRYRVPFLEACFVNPLNDGYKLDKLCPYVVAEELIYFGGMRNVSSTNCAQNVKLNVVLLQQTCSVQHSVKSRV